VGEVDDIGWYPALGDVAVVGAVGVVVGEVFGEVAAQSGVGDVEVAGEAGSPAFVEDCLVEAFDVAVGLGSAGVCEPRTTGAAGSEARCVAERCLLESQPCGRAARSGRWRIGQWATMASTFRRQPRRCAYLMMCVSVPSVSLLRSPGRCRWLSSSGVRLPGVVSLRPTRRDQRRSSPANALIPMFRLYTPLRPSGAATPAAREIARSYPAEACQPGSEHKLVLTGE
jgi:hypothetical protein